MLEGQGTAGSSDSGAGSVASTSTESTGTPGTTGSGGGGAASLVSGDGGSAPAVAGDAVAGSGVGSAGDPAAQAAAAAKFRFAGRDWDSQAQAEQAWKANLGRNWEPKLKSATEENARLQAELQDLRARVYGTGGQGQGAARVPDRPQAVDPNAPLAERLVKGGDLDFLTSLLETREGEDPSIGIKRFTLGLAQIVQNEVQQATERVRSQYIEPITQRTQQERAVAGAFGVVKQLASNGFPELDETNASPEAQEHQQAFIENLKLFPREWVAENQPLALLATALVTRYQYGTPVFAAPPGTSGSPSAAAVAASMQALSQATPDAISGTGTPRPRPNGQPETAEERIRRENAAVPGEFVSPSGKRLGFGPAV